MTKEIVLTIPDIYQGEEVGTFIGVFNIENKSAFCKERIYYDKILNKKFIYEDANKYPFFNVLNSFPIEEMEKQIMQKLKILK